MRKLLTILGVVVILISIVSQYSVAKDYPTKPINFINCMPPGGSWDVAGRSFAAEATKYLDSPSLL